MPLSAAAAGDRTDEENALLSMLFMTIGAAASHEAHNPDSVAALRDSTKFRTIPGRRGALIIPPAMRP
jgi:hypothetical protein